MASPLQAGRRSKESFERSENPRRGSLFQRWVSDWWLAEIIGVVISCLSTLALFLVLRAFSGHVAPQFGRSLGGGVSLATVVALLATLTVAAALSSIQECLSQLKWLWYHPQSRPLSDVESYDRASRGMTGSIQLLAKLRVKGSPIASIGALLVLVNIVIAPLSQQTLDIIATGVDAPGQDAFAWVAPGWADASQSTQTQELPRGYTTITSEVKGSILGGIFNSVDTQIREVDPVCETGNCTFPEYQTLGICTRYANITTGLEQSNGKGDEFTACLPGTGVCFNQTVDEPRLVATFASSASLENNPAFAGADTTGAISVQLNFTPVAFANHTNPLASVIVIGQDELTSSDKQSALQAFEFLIDWCRVTYSTKTENGLANTSRVNEEFLNLKLTDIAGFPNFFNLSDQPTPTLYTFCEKPMEKGCIIDKRSHHTMQRYLWATFNGTVDRRKLGLIQVETFATSSVVQKLSKTLSFSDSIGGGTAGLGDIINIITGTPSKNSSHFDTLLKNVAASMTNAVRTLSREGNPQTQNLLNKVQGAATAQQSVVIVFWGWFAVPAAFSVISLVFVLLVVFTASGPRDQAGSQPMPWKSSVVAAMRGLDGRLHRELGGLTATADMDREASSVRVRLVSGTDGWRLVPDETSAGDGHDYVEYSFPQQTFVPHAHSSPQQIPAHESHPGRGRIWDIK